MWRRKLFFWLDNLKITPAERKIVIIVALFLVTISVANLFIRKKQQFNRSYYSELRKIYHQKLKKAQKKDSLEKLKYYSGKLLSGNKDIEVTFKKSTPKRKGTHSDTLFQKKKSHNKLISINTAGIKELISLSGIGPKTALKIIKYREKHGYFKTLSSITKVKGIGEKKFEKLKSHISL